MHRLCRARLQINGQPEDTKTSGGGPLASDDKAGPPDVYRAVGVGRTVLVLVIHERTPD